MKQELFWARQLRKQFYHTAVLDRIELHLYRGELICLCGPSGSGKSVLAQLLTGRLKPDGGAIWMAGAPVRLYPPLRAHALGACYLTPEIQLVETLSLGENLCLPALPRACAGGYAAKTALRAQKVLDICGVSLDLRRRVRELPLFERLLAACVRAWRQQVRLLVCDGAFLMLSAREQDKLLDLLRAMCADGMCVVLVTQETVALQQADRVLLMENGLLTADLPAADFLALPQRAAPPSFPVLQQENLRPQLLSAPDGDTRRITVAPGGVTGLLCADLQQYRWYRSHPEIYGKQAVLLTGAQLECETFPDLSVAENLLLAAVRTLPAADRLRVRRFHHFAARECHEWLPIPLARWGEPMHHFGKQEIEQVILHRFVLAPARTLVLADVVDGDVQDVRQRFAPFLEHACARGKTVLLLSKNAACLQALCGHIEIL